MKTQWRVIIGIALAVVLTIVASLFVIIITETKAHSEPGVSALEPQPCDLRTSVRYRVHKAFGTDTPILLWTETYRSKVWWYDCANTHSVRTVKLSYKITGDKKNKHCEIDDRRKSYNLNAGSLDGWNPGWASFPCRDAIWYGSMTYHPRLSIDSNDDNCFETDVWVNRDGLIPVIDRRYTIGKLCVPRP